MTTGPTQLDADEYLHVAIAAVRRGDHQGALDSLKQGVAQFPADARLAHLAGAEYAQIGMPDRAEALLARAVQLDPRLYAASFQLGLLRLTLGRADDAAAAWRGLDMLPTEHAFRLFRDGLLALAAGNVEAAIAALERGMLTNGFSPDLNRDMTGVVGRIRQAQAAGENPGAGTDGHVLLNAYQSGGPSH